MTKGKAGPDREHGAALVELAITVVLLMMLLMGIISYGITNNHNIAIETAAREAARFGATYPVVDAGSLVDWLHDVAQAAEDGAAGSVDPGVDGRVICVAQGFGSSPSDFSRIRVTGNDAVATASDTSDWCFPNTAPDDDTVVQVQLQRDGWIQVVVFDATPTLTGQATNRFERAS
jgi:Flp pilus assembly protein TadG